MGGTYIQMVSGNFTGGMTIISGLARETVYTVEVAAVINAGTGVYSRPLTLGTSHSKPAKH